MPRIESVISNLPPDSTGYTQEELHAMQRATINLFKKWKINNSQAVILLGGISLSTFQRWKKGRYGRIGPDLAARMSNLLGIHKALRLLFSDPTRGYGWINRQSKIFESSALEIMLNGQLTDLMRVRKYLDSQRGL